MPTSSNLREVIVFAVDNSGSTWNIASYWDRVDQRYKDYVAEYSEAKIVPLLWNSKLVTVTHAQMRETIAQRKGRGGTYPSQVATYLVDNHGRLFHIAKLCIITDGEIDKLEVDHCDQILSAPGTTSSSGSQASPVSEIEACLFGPYTPDLSVVAPFARAAKFTIRTNDAVLAEGDASLAVESSGLLDEIQTPDDLFARFEDLNRIIVVQNLGRSNTKLRDVLLEMQKRLMEWIAWDNRRKWTEMQAAAGNDNDAMDVDQAGQVFSNPIMAALATGNHDKAVTTTKAMIDAVLEQGEEAVEDRGKRVARLIARLVDACTLGSFSVGALQSRRAQRATLAAAPDSGVPSAVEQDDPDMPDKFECPIMLDDAAVPVLLITADEHYHDDYSVPVGPPESDDDEDEAEAPAPRPEWTFVLDGADQFVVDDVTNCPLNLLKYPTLVSRLASRLDHAIGLDAFTGLYNAQYGVDMVSPFTRQPILGCIPLGTHHQHAHLGSFVVRRITTRGAVLGNAHLWVATVFCVIQHHVPRLAQNEPFMSAFRRHLKYRLATFESNLALSGLPGYPMFKVPLGVGLWYCLSGSSALFAENPDMQGQERLRQMWGVAKYMHELVDGVLGWPVGNQWDKRARVMRAFAYLMSRKNDGDKVFADVRRLYQASVVVKHTPIEWAAADQVDEAAMEVEGEQPDASDVVVLVDGPASPDMVGASPAAWLLDILPLNVIVKLTSLVDPQKKFGDVPLLPSNLSNLPEPEPKVNYGYNYSTPCTDGPTPICPATLRPFVQDVRDRKHWTDRAVSVYKCRVQDQLSAYSLFIDYVETRKAYPRSLADLIEYYAVRESGKAAENHPRDTLPSDVVEIAEEVVVAYRRTFALIHEQEGTEPNVARFKKIVSKTYNKDVRKELEDEWVKANGGVRMVKAKYGL